MKSFFVVPYALPSMQFHPLLRNLAEKNRPPVSDVHPPPQRVTEEVVPAIGGPSAGRRGPRHRVRTGPCDQLESGF